MTKWKLPSSEVSTNRAGEESIESMSHRHELTRRLVAEAHLLECLNLLEKLANDDQDSIISPFLDKYKENLKQEQV